MFLFQGLSTDQYKQVMHTVEQAILSTDMALYFAKKDKFLDVANKGEIDWKVLALEVTEAKELGVL